MEPKVLALTVAQFKIWLLLKISYLPYRKPFEGTNLSFPVTIYCPTGTDTLPVYEMSVPQTQVPADSSLNNRLRKLKLIHIIRKKEKL